MTIHLGDWSDRPGDKGGAHRDLAGVLHLVPSASRQLDSPSNQRVAVKRLTLIGVGEWRHTRLGIGVIREPLVHLEPLSADRDHREASILKHPEIEYARQGSHLGAGLASPALAATLDEHHTEGHLVIPGEKIGVHASVTRLEHVQREHSTGQQGEATITSLGGSFGPGGIGAEPRAQLGDAITVELQMAG